MKHYGIGLTVGVDHNITMLVRKLCVSRSGVVCLGGTRAVMGSDDQRRRDG